MKKQISKKTYIISAILFCFYLTLLFGFFINENSSGGAMQDFNHHMKIVFAFDANFFDSVSNYRKFNNNHSPLFIIFLLSIYKIVGDVDILRFVFLHFSLLIPLLFYFCLNEIYVNQKKINIILLSSVVFLSPYYRSLSIWPGSEIISVIFLLLSFLFFIKFEKNKGFKFALLNIFFLAISAYYRPILGLFSVYFFYKFFEFYGITIRLIWLTATNILLSLPAFYFLIFINNFIPDVYANEYNISNKVIIIPTILFFHLIPFVLLFYKSIKIINFQFTYVNYLIIILIFLIFLQFFDFDPKNVTNDFMQLGGGVIFRLSEITFENNYFFYTISLISFFIIYKIILVNKVDHSLLFLILLLQTPQTYYYHEYYEPLLLIIIFCLFDKSLTKEFFTKKVNIQLLYLFYIFFYCSSLIKQVEFFNNI